jgi:hypothetical protein
VTTSLGRLVRPALREQPGPAGADPRAAAAPSAPPVAPSAPPAVPARPVRATHPADTHPADTHPADTHPADTHPVDLRPVSGVRRLAADGAAAAVMITVTPLGLLQAPNAMAWVLNTAGSVAAGPGGPTALLRAAGLALPAMAAAAGLTGLAVRRLHAWPVLLAGLLVMAVADVLGGSARTVTAVAVIRVLHGIAAGLALPAALALAWDRAPRPRRWLTALWSAALVAGLAAAPAVARTRLSSGGWHAALAPFPWLTGAALIVAALYAVLADGPGTGYRGRAGWGGASTAQARSRGRQDAIQERAQLAVLAVPGLGLAVLAVAVTYRPPAALLATGAVAVFMLYGVAAVASADRLVGGPLCFPFLGAVTGLVVAPAAGAVTSLRVLAPNASGGPSWLPLGVTAAAALAGLAVALALPRRPRAVVVVGLLIAVEGLAAARMAGPWVPALVLAGVSAPLAAGLAAALTAALAESGVASALAGVSLLLAGLMTGYLAAGAVQVRMVTDLTVGSAAERTALAGAVGVWELAGLFSLLLAIAVIFLTGKARRSGADAR